MDLLAQCGFLIEAKGMPVLMLVLLPAIPVLSRMYEVLP